LKCKLVALRKLFLEREELQKQYKKENHTLQTKYEEIYKPIYDKRLKLVEGSIEVNPEDVATEAPKVNILDIKAVSYIEKGIPSFWCNSISNCYQFKPLINTNDKKILNHLKDIRVVYLENNNFSLQFHFDINEFFEHDILEKTFFINPITMIISKIVSTTIQWKNEDLNPTIEKKKKKLKKKNEIKTITKIEEIASFFNFFMNYEYDENKIKNTKKNEEDMDEDDEEEEEEDMLEVMEDEYDLGLFLKDDFIPFALEYYLGINPEEAEDDGEDEELDDEEEEDIPQKKSNKHSKK
jgi:nucleosome assembly protein 1-like 1